MKEHTFDIHHKRNNATIAKFWTEHSITPSWEQTKYYSSHNRTKNISEFENFRHKRFDIDEKEPVLIFHAIIASTMSRNL